MKKKLIIAVLILILAATAIVAVKRFKTPVIKETAQVVVNDAQKTETLPQSPPQDLKKQDVQIAPSALQSPQQIQQEQQKEIILKHGILKEWLEASDNFNIYRDAIGQKIVEGIGMSDHPLKEGFLITRWQGYIDLKKEGAYRIVLLNEGKKDLHTFIDIAGLTFTRTVSANVNPQAGNGIIDINLSKGIKKFIVAVGYQKTAADALPVGFSLLMAPAGMPPKPFGTVYNEFYEVYYDKNLASKLGEEKIYKIEN